MDQISQSADFSALEAQIRECYGRVVYSAKTHEKDSDRSTDKLNVIKWAQIILSALTTGGILTTCLGEPSSLNYPAMIIATVCSTLQLALNTYAKNVDPGQEAESYKKTAVELWDVRESYLSILIDLCGKNPDLDAIKVKRDQLQGRLASIYKTAPRTTNKAYKLAGKALKINEEMTFSTEEINLLLPEALRKNTRSHFFES